MLVVFIPGIQTAIKELRIILPLPYFGGSCSNIIDRSGLWNIGRLIFTIIKVTFFQNYQLNIEVSIDDFPGVEAHKSLRLVTLKAFHLKSEE